MKIFTISMIKPRDKEPVMARISSNAGSVSLLVVLLLPMPAGPAGPAAAVLLLLLLPRGCDAPRSRSRNDDVDRE
jgi:hypothetical protein